MNCLEFPASLSQDTNATLSMCYISSFFRFEKLRDRKSDIVTWWVMKTVIPEFMLLKYCLCNIYIYIYIPGDVPTLVMIFRQRLWEEDRVIWLVYINISIITWRMRHQVNPKCQCISNIIHDVTSQYLRRNAQHILILVFKVQIFHSKVHPRNKIWRSINL